MFIKSTLRKLYFVLPGHKKRINNCISILIGKKVKKVSNDSNEFAKILYRMGMKPRYSMGICESLTCGYGKLDDNGYFEYPLYFKET